MSSHVYWTFDLLDFDPANQEAIGIALYYKSITHRIVVHSTIVLNVLQILVVVVVAVNRMTKVFTYVILLPHKCLMIHVVQHVEEKA